MIQLTMCVRWGLLPRGVSASETILLNVRLRLALTFALDLPQSRLHSDRPALVHDETRSLAARSGYRSGRYHHHEPDLLPPRHDQLQKKREPPPAPAK